MSNKKLLQAAQELLNNLEGGKEFPSKYVYDRLVVASEKHPKDIMINTMRDVIQKKASTQTFISQKEIGSLYNSLYKYSGSHSEFRNEFPELLPSDFGVGSLPKKDASASRFDMGKPLVSLQDTRTDLNALAKEFEGVFSLDKKGSFSAFDNSIQKKAEKFANLQLKSIGCTPREVKAVSQNDHFILCMASYTNNSNTEVSLKIPVQIKNANPSFPTHFVDGDELADLNQQNVLVYLKENEHLNIKNAKSKFNSLRSTDSIQIDRVEVPKELSKYAELEQELIEATTKYDRNTVRLATSILDAELKSFGLVNPQIRVNSSYDRGLVYDVDLNLPTGKTRVQVPVEISSGQPLPPVKFSFNNESLNFDKRGFDKITTLNKVASNVSMVNENMSLMDFNQLMNVMIVCANNEDFRGAEDALNVIQTKFSGQQISNAISKYSQLLKNASSNSERNTFIKEAVRKGDLIKVPTMLDLYSPKFKLPLSKLAFDAQGELVPKYRHQNENLKNSETVGISTSQIKLT